jgi:hypothetical protein
MMCFFEELCEDAQRGAIGDELYAELKAMALDAPTGPKETRMYARAFHVIGETLDRLAGELPEASEADTDPPPGEEVVTSAVDEGGKPVSTEARPATADESHDAHGAQPSRAQERRRARR